jgi:hypothetical protein
MIDGSHGEFQGSGNVAILEIWIILKDLFPCRAERQHFKYVRYPDTKTANAGFA